MSWEKELQKELRKLKKAFWKTFLNSKEFKNFKRRLKELNLNADVFLALFIFGDQRASLSTTRKIRIRAGKRNRSLKLTKEDREFLRMHGIKWE
jgi:hypothetical protein